MLIVINTLPVNKMGLVKGTTTLLNTWRSEQPSTLALWRSSAGIC